MGTESVSKLNDVVKVKDTQHGHPSLGKVTIWKWVHHIAAIQADAIRILKGSFVRYVDEPPKKIATCGSHPLESSFHTALGRGHMGSHIYGFIAVVAHTYVLQQDTALARGLKENYDMVRLDECARTELCSLTIFFMKSMVIYLNTLIQVGRVVTHMSVLEPLFVAGQPKGNNNSLELIASFERKGINVRDMDVCDIIAVSYRKTIIPGAFETIAKISVLNPKVQKIGPKYVDCIFIGYAKNNNAYRFIVHDSKNPDIQKDTIMESRNASVFENIFLCLTKKIRRSSRINDKVVQDKRQQDDNDLQDERQDQPGEEEVEPRRSKRARTKKSFEPDFVSFIVENEPTSHREAVTSLKGPH
nr:zinc finger, CCHC-type [Tanacetum cinerariifolium]